METKETTMAEAEPEMMTRRKIKSLDDDELWAGFDWKETDRIQSGEIKPKTLITTICPFGHFQRFPQRTPLIIRLMLSVFPNSRYRKTGKKTGFCKVAELAKKRGCTSLILAQTNRLGDDEIKIISLLNGASATFRIVDFIPLADVPNPPIRRYPELHMKYFDSPALAGTARVIRSLFPEVPHTRPLSTRRSIAWFEMQNDLIIFLHKRLCIEQVLTGESSTARKQIQDCGPKLALQLTAVESVSFDTGTFKLICIRHSYRDPNRNLWP